MTRKMKYSGVEWIGYIPEGWEVSKLKHIGFFSASGIDKKIKKNENRVKIVNYVDIYHSKNKLIKNYNYMEVTASSEKIKEHNLIKGDALFTPSSETIEEIGYSAIIDEGLMDTSYSYHLLRFRFNKEIVHNYKRFMFSNESLLNQFASRARGTTRKTLNRIDFEEAVVPLPSKIEQKSIANFLDEKTLEIDNIISKTKKAIEEYKQYKQSLITETVTNGLDKNVQMKDSGIEWIGDIPEHWEVIRLGFLGRLQNGINKAGEEFGFGFPFINYGDIYRNYQLDKSEFSGLVNSTEKERENYSVKKGDVLFTRTSEIKEEIGYAATCLENIENAVFTGFAIRFRPFKKSRLYPGFSKYYFRSEIHRKYFVKEMNIVTRVSLGQELLMKLSVLLPPLDEQEKISTYLDEKCEEIDNVISKKEKLLEEMEAYKKSLIYETVTGKREVR